VLQLELVSDKLVGETVMSASPDLASDTATELVGAALSR
jgi:hypothetical protein